ncbi:MAG: tetratricopeptide repeat protein, partial [Atopobiaceae bacterium]|nr:tetratricopeptide repeat protein [Atopobiaceae bacterium]
LAEADEGNYDDAIAELKALGDFGDASQQVVLVEQRMHQAQYDEGMDLFEAGDYEAAYMDFEAAAQNASNDDAEAMRVKAARALAEDAESAGNTTEALEWYEKAGDEESANRVKYDYALNHFDSKDGLTQQYLSDLARAQYPGAADLYTDLFDVHFSMQLVTETPDKYYFTKYNVSYITDEKKPDYKGIYLGIKVVGDDLNGTIFCVVHSEDTAESYSTNPQTLNGSREMDSEYILTPNVYHDGLNEDGFVYYELLSINTSAFKSWTSTVSVIANGQELTEEIVLK